MRLAVLAITGVLGLATTAQAAPFAPSPVSQANPDIIQVWGGCGPGSRPVPGHWRGPYWVPPHCTPAYRVWGPRPYYRPYWRHYY